LPSLAHLSFLFCYHPGTRAITTLSLHDALPIFNGQGVIRVSLIHERDTVGFSVCDNGCGMSEEFIENSLFRPFHTTKKKGLGIGDRKSTRLNSSHQIISYAAFCLKKKKHTTKKK